MRGIVFLGNRKLEIQEFPDPTPGPGEVVLEMKASGMCGSDLHPYRAAGNAAAAPESTGHTPVAPSARTPSRGRSSAPPPRRPTSPAPATLQTAPPLQPPAGR